MYAICLYSCTYSLHLCMYVCVYVCLRASCILSLHLFCAMHVRIPMPFWCTYDCLMCLMCCLICLIMSCILRLSYMYCLLWGCLDVRSSLSSDCDVVHASVAKQHAQVNCRPAFCWQQSNACSPSTHEEYSISIYQPAFCWSQSREQHVVPCFCVHPRIIFVQICRSVVRCACCSHVVVFHCIL